MDHEFENGAIGGMDSRCVEYLICRTISISADEIATMLSAE